MSELPVRLAPDETLVFKYRNWLIVSGKHDTKRAFYCLHACQKTIDADNDFKEHNPNSYPDSSSLDEPCMFCNRQMPDKVALTLSLLGG